MSKHFVESRKRLEFVRTPQFCARVKGPIRTPFPRWLRTSVSELFGKLVVMDTDEKKQIEAQQQPAGALDTKVCLIP